MEFCKKCRSTAGGAGDAQLLAEQIAGGAEALAEQQAAAAAASRRQQFRGKPPLLFIPDHAGSRLVRREAGDVSSDQVVM